MIYEYTLDNGKIPSWVEDHGYFPDPETGKVIGYSSKTSSVPDSAVQFTEDQLITRALNSHTKHPYTTLVEDDPVGIGPAMTNDQVTAMVRQWVSDHGL
jgi:hypothetical protein